MKGKLKGFVEGTIGVTTGEPKKPTDHRRHKTRCKSYRNGRCSHMHAKCVGSAHCLDYDDGIEAIIENGVETDKETLENSKNELLSFLKELKTRIYYNTLEGEIILAQIRNEYSLVKPNIEEAERQEAAVTAQTRRLKREIEEHNHRVKIKSLLIGVLIITIPFALNYYDKKLRNFHREAERIKERIIDVELQKEVKRYRIQQKNCEQEINEYKKKSREWQSAKRGLSDTDWCAKAQTAYSGKDFKNFYFFIRKAIDVGDRKKAVLYLLKMFDENEAIKKGSSYAIFLLYGSYLDVRECSERIAKLFLEKNPESEYGKRFLDKVNKGACTD